MTVELGELLLRAKESRDFGALVGAIPYLEFLGVGIDVQDGELVGRMAYADSLIGNASLPALHGGAIGALLESTAILTTVLESETRALPKIVTITIDYLRSGRPVDTFARAVITKQGRRVVNVSVDAWQEDRTRPIARAHAIFLIEPPESGE